MRDSRQLGRQPPDLHAHAARHEQVDDAPARVLGDRPPALRAPEAVRAPLVVGAHANREVVGGQLHVPAARAVGPDRCHRVTRPWFAFDPASPPFGGDTPFGRPQGRLRLRSLLRVVTSAAIGRGRRGTMRGGDGHHVRPPWRAARGAREHDPGVPARRSTPARPGLETDVWLIGRRRGRLRARPRRGPGCAAARSPRTTAAELAELGVPRLADVYDELGTAFELLGRREGRARRPAALVDVAPALRRARTAVGVLAATSSCCGRCATNRR